MAISINEADVNKVITTSLSSISYQVQAAELLVNEDLVNIGLTDDRLKQIGVYLAAHLVALSDSGLRIKSLNLDGVHRTYFGETGKGLMATQYGQIAMDMDPTGKLRDLNKSKARFAVI